MKTTEEETKQSSPPPAHTKGGESATGQDKSDSAEKKKATEEEAPAKKDDVKAEKAKKGETSASAKATADKPAEKPALSGDEGGEAKEEEGPPKKKRKSERQEEAALSEDEGKPAEVMVEQKAEMDIKIQNGHVSISTGKVELPVFRSGDTITVHYKILEGSKERIQQFQGVVIQRKGSYTTETCTIRKVSGGIGVERIFPLHSPFIDKIVVNKRGKVRRARIFYLRELKGKKARIKEKK